MSLPWCWLTGCFPLGPWASRCPPIGQELGDDDDEVKREAWSGENDTGQRGSRDESLGSQHKGGWGSSACQMGAVSSKAGLGE